MIDSLEVQVLAFAEESRGAAPTAFVGGTESELAKRRAERSGSREIFRCARLSPALPAGETPAPERDEPPHRESSLGLMKVTT